MEKRILTNSIGMSLVKVEAGSFIMGQERGGELDENPVHLVHIAQPFLMSATEVTNCQYEQFDPEHASRRGIKGLSANDDEAAVWVSWYDVVNFCAWLSNKEGRSYRLPTEAEWEYACRAGSSAAYSTGDELPDIYHKNQKDCWAPQPVSLKAGATPANGWGLHDVHGNVEEWCQDWYGPYPSGEQTDPIGCAAGIFKVTRGGSHNADIRYLRSASRQGALPEDKNWLIGFRVVLGELPDSKPITADFAPRWADRVSQVKAGWNVAMKTSKSSFAGPVRYVRFPAKPETVPMYWHNHCPSITWCDNGDLFAIWYSCVSEAGREMTILASRLRQDNDEWDLPAAFFKAPGRNMTGSSLFNNGRGTIYHFNGISTGYGWGDQILVCRFSTDNGATWSKPSLIGSCHQHSHTLISGASETKEGWILQPCDATPDEISGTVLYVSKDGGESWQGENFQANQSRFKEGEASLWIAGIHAGVIPLNSGNWLALGRGQDIQGQMPVSMSEDHGKTWICRASGLPPISSCQRLALLRLREGPILLLSFTDSAAKRQDKKWVGLEGLLAGDASGVRQNVYGLYAALSYDDGRTWPVKKIISPGNAQKIVKSDPWTGEFVLDGAHAEPAGYLAATQSPDRRIHLVSSALYYQFNLTWLEQGEK